MCPPFLVLPFALLHANVDALVAKHGIDANSPGVAILVVQNGKPLFEKGYGLARLRDKTPLTPQTTFELASLSKTFTGTAVLRLCDQGKLALTDDVRKYLPELPPYLPLRLSDLLHHTSGLPEYFAFKNVASKNPKFADNDDYLPQFALQLKEFPQRFVPGQKFEYANSNYLLLAAVIARVSKKSYGEFLRDEFFAPLAMKNSWVYEKPTAPPKGHRLNAIGYTKQAKGGYRESWGSPPFRDEHLLTTGDGGVWTNLDDLKKWDAAVRAGKLLKATTWEQARQPSTTRDGKTNHYGHGWSLYPDAEGKVRAFGHDGSWAGFRTSYYRDDVGDRTIILLSNRGDLDLNTFWAALVAILDRK